MTESRQNEIVSFIDEQLIVVDEQDNILDYKSKIACHQGEGILHRAFSIFIFNGAAKLILQKRSNQKFLWPNFWSNSCCSHPRKGETNEEATRRRLKEELGIETDLLYLYTFQYHVRYASLGAEREQCAVYIGRSDDPIRINKNEIAECKFLSIQSVSKELKKNPEQYTPWFKMEWSRIMAEYYEMVDALFI